ncbi:cation:proton antiporter [Streptomyces sp. PT12]|uniref:cation:proton antiporter n=1 Tax=Streptomyces sp. PT12 TaxID=1510197 RepID=UPI000DE1DB4A|nr:cation:proton antiporter [Streptomyces sp. PT12]RBM23372.1 cation/H(+) antiporter [Streptomyces sp. PT12]
MSLSADSVPVAPIPEHELLLLLLQIGLLLLMALLLGRLAVRLRMPAIVGELCAGVLMGPSLLTAVAPGVAEWLFPQEPGQMHLLDAVGQLGVLLLVGFTGVHLDMSLVRRHGAKAAGVSAAGLLVPLAMGLGLGLLLPNAMRGPEAETLTFALFVGVAMSVSAIPVIARTLIDMGLLHRTLGQLILVVGTVDDAIGWLLLSVVAAMATTGLDGGELVWTFGQLGLVLLCAATVGRVVVGAAMRLAARSEVRGMPIAASVVLITLAAAGTHALGLEAVFGAFLCGILIGRTTEEVGPRRLEPLNTTVLVVLAPLFFATAGLRMDLTALADPVIALWAGAVVATAIAGKFIGAFVGALGARMSRWEALALGAGMNARGVIEVIIAMAGVRLGLLSTEMFSVVVLVAVLTSVMAPPLLRFAMSRVERTADEDTREQRALAWHVPHQPTVRGSG